MTAEELKVIKFRASVLNMSIDEYIIRAGYYNPMRLQIEQFKDFGPVWEKCMIHLADVKNVFAQELLQREFQNLYEYILSLTPDIYSNNLSARFGGTYKDPLSAPTEKETPEVTDVKINISDKSWRDLNRYAEMMRTDLPCYLVYSHVFPE